MKEKKFVISLGGSVVFSEKINIDFLKKFSSFIKEKIKKNYKFIIVIGGGEITRNYQKAAGEIVNVSNEDKDWIGIHATRLNAHFLRTIFRKEAYPVVFDKRFKVIDFNSRYNLIIASGWRPGWSTDYVAVQIAVDFNIKVVINLSKISYVYTSDLDKDPKAKPIKEISWENYLKIIPNKWTPGMHVPVDPVAAKLAKEEKIKVIVAKGDNFKNLENILEGKKFKGTILK